MKLQAVFENKELTIFEEDITFSKNYISVRKKENRILSDEEIKRLPFTKKNNPHAKEWQLRQKSTQRFLNYIKKKDALKILDIGCGNGWFTNAIASVSKNNKIIGLDVNLTELEQAHRVFKKENIRFVCADIFKRKDLFKNSFNIIVLNGTIQYFPNFKELIQVLTTFLELGGEIHIIDSPFYKLNEIELAKKRTIDYYTQLGFFEMSSYYFHHSIDNITNFESLYTPKRKLLQKFLFKDTPFPWIRFIKK